MTTPRISIAVSCAGWAILEIVVLKKKHFVSSGWVWWDNNSIHYAGSACRRWRLKFVLSSPIILSSISLWGHSGNKSHCSTFKKWSEYKHQHSPLKKMTKKNLWHKTKTKKTIPKFIQLSFWRARLQLNTGPARHQIRTRSSLSTPTTVAHSLIKNRTAFWYLHKRGAGVREEEEQNGPETGSQHQQIQKKIWCSSKSFRNK